MTHLAHVPIDPRSFAEWAGTRAMPRGGGFDEGLAMHVLLAAVFGQGVFQPFRLFSPERGPWSLYGYAEMDQDALAAAAHAVAPPEMLDVLPLDRLRTKQMPESFAVGTRLGFDLRVRPVRRGKSEKDAFLWEATTRFPDDAEGMGRAGRTREAVYADWLAERLGGAARTETCRMVRFQRRRSRLDGRPVEGPDATLQGTLVIDDGAAFARLLASGVGRHRAYGYGMLMLRPPDRAAPMR